MVLQRSRNASGPLRSDLRNSTRHGERQMKTIMSALALSALAAGFAAPASADYRIPSVASQYVDKYVGTQSVDAGRYVKLRRFSYQGEYIADTKPVGSAGWWQQMDREQRGGRR
jgi:hypothetical protein